MTLLVKKLIKKIISLVPLSFVERYTLVRLGYYSVSYSQFGEDMVLRDLFNSQKNGFYVDVGAHHPERFSNTYWFYRRGWSGINIDATPGSMREFDRKRPRDTNIETAVSEKQGELTFFTFEKGSFNTLSKEVSVKQVKANQKIKKEVKVKSNRLENILRQYMPPNQEINFMSIDAEGMDLEVLKSNDWQKYKPKVIAIEESGFDLENPGRSQIFSYLKERGYKLIRSTGKTIFFIHSN